MTAIFVTATGTDVGKTYVAASLIGHFRQMGRVVEAIKPVVSGFDPAQSGNSDPGLLLRAVGSVGHAGLDRAHFAMAVSRAAVARHGRTARETVSINVDDVISFCQSAVEQRRDLLLIEGVGGIMVPLDGERTVLDVMMALRLPLILVTGSYLGTISHTLTALNSLYRRDMNVLAIIVSETANSTVPLDDTVAEISRFAEPVIAVPRRRRDGGPPGGGASSGPFGAIFDPKGRRAR